MFFVVLAFKIVVYCATTAAAMFFSLLEKKLKKELADVAAQANSILDIYELDGPMVTLEYEQVLKVMEQELLHKARIVMGLKFLFIALLIMEAITLQG